MIGSWYIALSIRSTVASPSSLRRISRPLLRSSLSGMCLVAFHGHIVTPAKAGVQRLDPRFRAGLSGKMFGGDERMPDESGETGYLLVVETQEESRACATRI